MEMEWLPTNSKQILDEIVCAENPAQMLCERFKRASDKEDDELRGIIRELRQKGYIDVKWADNVPYHVIINNSARTYNEQFAHYKALHEIRKVTERNSMEPIIFISHRSTDKAIADMLLDFFTGTGIPKNAVFCSSLPGNDISEKISGEVKDALRNSAANICILSRDYYQSAYCLNEAGIFWFQNDVAVIPVALSEIDASKMYGFLNSEFKLRRLDIDTDISYIYDTVREAASVQQTKASIITYETQKLKDRYIKFCAIRENPMLETIPAIASNLTTDDERIVLYYILEKNVRKVSKDAVIEWLHKNEIYNVNIDNAFDLLSSLGNGTVKNDVLELSIELFRMYSSNAASFIPELKSCQESHIKLASDTFKKLWKSIIADPTITLFVAYIIEEKMISFGDRWMADNQIKNIQQWESKQTLDSTLSENYGSCLELFKQNDFVYESSWTSYGNPREYTLCTSLQNLFLNHFGKYVQELQQAKDNHHLDLPF